MIIEQLPNGAVRVNLWWRNWFFDLYVYVCENTSRNLEEEIKFRGITPDNPVALIPETLISSHIELVLGAVHYKLYSHRIQRVKNKGLALALLTLGEKQLDRLINLIEKAVADGLRYYLVSLDKDVNNKNGCTTLKIESRTLERNEFLKLVKNVDALLFTI